MNIPIKVKSSHYSENSPALGSTTGIASDITDDSNIDALQTDFSKLKPLSHVPLSLYIHLPWCVKKCPYCDFNSYANPQELPEEEYIKILSKDLDDELCLVGNRAISSIFFGGGTPSLFSSHAIAKIIDLVKEKVKLKHEVEITLEANPGTLEHANFNNYQAAGITRISLGAQSFQDEKLKSLGRIHSSKEIEKALTALKNTNLKFNIDIMYGLPQQTVDDALYDLEKALSYDPHHLSWYHLTLEPNTIFYSKPPSLPQEEIIDSMQDEGYERILASGFNHYEVSAFAKPGEHCRHNLNYWEFGDYIGIGAGAHGKVSVQNLVQCSQLGAYENKKTPFSILRTAKKRFPKSYMNEASLIASQKFIPHSETAFEFMLNALRLNQGFSEHLYVERTGLPIECIAHQLKQAQEKELIVWENKTIVPTKLGRRFLNDLVGIFL